MSATLAWPFLSLLVLPIGWIEFRLLARTRHGICLVPSMFAVLYGPWIAASYVERSGIRWDLEMPVAVAMVVLAVVLWLTGGPMILRADRQLTTYPETLVTAGPYRWVRHPLYLGHVLFISALPLMAGADAVFLETPILWILASIVSRYEEVSRLTPRFGDEFQVYRARVPLLMSSWGWAAWGLIYAAVCHRYFG